MCSDVSTEDWDSLLSPLVMEAVDIPDEDDEVAPTDGSHVTASTIPVGTARASSSSSAPSTRSQSRKKCDSGHNLAFDDSCDDEAAHNHRLADITNYQRWEAKVQGHTYFGKEELRKCNEINENYIMKF